MDGDVPAGESDGQAKPANPTADHSEGERFGREIGGVHLVGTCELSFGEGELVRLLLKVIHIRSAKLKEREKCYVALLARPGGGGGHRDSLDPNLNTLYITTLPPIYHLSNPSENAKARVGKPTAKTRRRGYKLCDTIRELVTYLS